ncbi:MAG: GNAT family N-acetyltransferase [Angelakisella sp.]|nr:GNAT family N-acetyltransferase [Angelakisella sp.]
MEIHRFNPVDAEAVSQLVCRNLLEVNSKDYPLAEMQKMAKQYDAAKIMQIASTAHLYVLCDDNTIVGSGAIDSLNGSLTESILLTVFVLPEYHGKGLGQKIIHVLEQDEFFLRAKRIEVPASLTACAFYEKMGYWYKGGTKPTVESSHFEAHYDMEKHR